MNHLYIQTAFLGDLLLAIPALKQIRYWSPQSAIHLVCRQGYGELMKSLGVCERVIEVNKSSKKSLIKNMENESFHTIFCPHQSVSSHRIVKSLKAEQKIGYKNTWNASYFTHRVERNLQWPEAIRQLQLLGTVSEAVAINLEAFAQKTDAIPHWADMHLKQVSWSEEEVRQMVSAKVQGLNVGTPYVCIAPGSVWATKRWSQKSYVKAATDLARKNYQIVILGAPDERSLCEKLQKEIPNSFSLAGQLSVLQSMMLLSKASGIVCNDSGAMHMASVVGCPTVAVFGPTVTELGYKPWNSKAQVIENNSLLCRPCGQHGGRQCPIGTHQCMTSVSHRAVVDEALSIFR